MIGGFSAGSSELVSGHSVLEPLKLFKKNFFSKDDSSLNLLKYVSDFIKQLSKTCDTARTNPKSVQRKMKPWYDINTKEIKKTSSLVTASLIFCLFLENKCKKGCL